MAVRLLVFHFHDRPGGVREVIGRGLPLLVERLAAAGEVSGVDFLAGELGDAGWRAALEESVSRAAARAGLSRLPLRWIADAEWGYGPPGSASLSKASAGKLREILTPLLPAAGKPERTVLWAHNLSVGRNIPLLRALPEMCRGTGAELWLHHHDWWWDGRWARWRDWLAAGGISLEEALSVTVPAGPHIQHRCVNLADLRFLQAAAGPAAARWVGNPLPLLTPPTAAETRAARRWLMARTGGRPVWLAPVRPLRRKNLAEALLITRCLAPEACLVTTAGCSSAEETPFWEKLRAPAVRHGWPLVPQVLSGSGRGAESRPSVSALMAASEAVVLTSLQEGFGLPWLEAGALGKPVASRRLPEVMANLAGLGCRLSGTWRTLPVPQEFYSHSAERARVGERRRLLSAWLPQPLREAMGNAEPETGGPVDFGTLTLEAQLEVLSGNPQRFPLPADIGADPVRWPEENRQDAWADRFFSGSRALFPEDKGQARGTALTGLTSLRDEVDRRLRHWLRHPLLWPD